MSEQFLKSLRENWIFILFIGGMVAGWTTFGGDISSLKSRMTANEATDREQTIQISGQSAQLSAINAKLDIILGKFK